MTSRRRVVNRVRVTRGPRAGAIFQGGDGTSPYFVGKSEVRSYGLYSFSVIVGRNSQATLCYLRSYGYLRGFFLTTSKGTNGARGLSYVCYRVGVVRDFCLFFIFAIRAFSRWSFLCVLQFEAISVRVCSTTCRRL